MLADHKTMAALGGLQTALDKPTAGQQFVSEIKATKQVECAIDRDVVQVFALSLQDSLDIVRRERFLALLQHLQHQPSGSGCLVSLGPQDPGGILNHSGILPGSAAKCNIIAIKLESAWLTRQFCRRKRPVP